MRIRTIPQSRESRHTQSNISQNGRWPILARVCVPLADLTLDPMNPRVHDPRQIRQIARSIETLGSNLRGMIDQNKRVVAGHDCILTCRLLEWTKVLTTCPRAPRRNTQKVARTVRGGAD
jgi:hypothetical protein